MKKIGIDLRNNRKTKFIGKFKSRLMFLGKKDVPMEDTIMNHPTLKNGLINYFKFDGDFNDNVGDENINLLSNIAITEGGKFNQGIIGNYPDIGSGELRAFFNGLNVSTEFTMFGWYKPLSSTYSGNSFTLDNDAISFNVDFMQGSGVALSIDSEDYYHDINNIIENEYNFIAVGYKDKEFVVMSNGQITHYPDSEYFSFDFLAINEIAMSVGWYSIADELGIVNRLYIDQELLDLYNNGKGLPLN